MERLTAQRCNGIKTGYWSPAKKDDLVQRLGPYEDIGLEPAEIVKRLKDAEKAAVPAPRILCAVRPGPRGRGEVPISAGPELPAHELAHVAAGEAVEHGPEWKAAEEAIFQKYNEILDAKIPDEPVEVTVTPHEVGDGGIFWTLLAVAFIVLKVTHLIDWPWVWVLAPIWIPTGIVLAAIVVVLIVVLTKETIRSLERRNRR